VSTKTQLIYQPKLLKWGWFRVGNRYDEIMAMADPHQITYCRWSASCNRWRCEPGRSSGGIEVEPSWCNPKRGYCL